MYWRCLISEFGIMLVLSRHRHCSFHSRPSSLSLSSLSSNCWILLPSNQEPFASLYLCIARSGSLILTRSHALKASISNFCLISICLQFQQSLSSATSAFYVELLVGICSG